MEVDLVLERGAGMIAGVEVKASATVTASDFRGLRKLAGAAGARFARGVVLYDGETSVSFGDRLHAVPISRLWAKPSREEVFARPAELPPIELGPPAAEILRDERRRR